MADKGKGGKDECIQVVVRCRPFSSTEKERNCKKIVNIHSAGSQVELQDVDTPESSTPKSFTFDSTFDENTQQKNFYDECCFNIVENVLEGYNCTIFAYGQTGCGKSWTMQGLQQPSDLRGVIPNSFAHVFDRVKASSDVEYLIRCSYLEIYSEEIRDLFVVPSGSKKEIKCELKEDPEKGVFVKNLSSVVVENEDQVSAQLAKGIDQRTVASTLMNSESSRSHSIFTLVVEMSRKDPVSGKDIMRVGKLNLVDLAGSERQKKTGASGDTLKEGAKINLSLSALGNVISALSEGRSKHIPYRDSKLTRLLQDSLGGNTKTLMIAAIGPADYNYDETLSTLRYANRAKNIKNKPIVNEDPKDTMLREFKEEIERLRKMLEQNAGNSPAPNATGNGDWDFASIVHESNNQQQSSLAKELEDQLKAKEDEIQNEKNIRAELEERLKQLQHHFVHGATSAGDAVGGGSIGEKNSFGDTTTSLEERMNAEKRLSERKAKSKKMKNRNRESANNDATSDDQSAANTKDAEKIVAKRDKRIRLLKDELEDVKDDFFRQQQNNLETIRSHEVEMKLYEQICKSILTDKQFKRLVEKSRWNDEDNEWIIPYDKHTQSTGQQKVSKKSKLESSYGNDKFEDDPSGSCQQDSYPVAQKGGAGGLSSSHSSLPSIGRGAPSLQGGMSISKSQSVSSGNKLPTSLPGIGGGGMATSSSEAYIDDVYGGGKSNNPNDSEYNYDIGNTSGYAKEKMKKKKEKQLQQQGNNNDNNNSNMDVRYDDFDISEYTAMKNLDLSDYNFNDNSLMASNSNALDEAGAEKKVKNKKDKVGKGGGGINLPSIF